jgi:hypothetical protein
VGHEDVRRPHIGGAISRVGADANARVGEVYGPSKHLRLVALKRRWDPHNVFRLNANIAPEVA